MTGPRPDRPPPLIRRLPQRAGRQGTRRDLDGPEVKAAARFALAVISSADFTVHFAPRLAGGVQGDPGGPGGPAAHVLGPARPRSRANPPFRGRDPPPARQALAAAQHRPAAAAGLKDLKLMAAAGRAIQARRPVRRRPAAFRPPAFRSLSHALVFYRARRADFS